MTTADNTEVLRNKIKEDLDFLDTDDLRKLYNMVAAMAAEKATKLADKDWMEIGISRETIKEEVKRYRQSHKELF